jgi:hypothetical protein
LQNQGINSERTVLTVEIRNIKEKVNQFNPLCLLVEFLIALNLFTLGLSLKKDSLQIIHENLKHPNPKNRKIAAKKKQKK